MSDCLLEDGEPDSSEAEEASAAAFDRDEETFAFNSFSDFEGESAENRERAVGVGCAEVSACAATGMLDETEDMEAFEVLRRLPRPIPIDSRTGFRVDSEELIDDVVVCRGIRGVVFCGGDCVRTVESLRVPPVTVLEGDEPEPLSELSKMPNSASDEMGDAASSTEDDEAVAALPRRTPTRLVDDLEAVFDAGDVRVDPRLWIRGILVGVSLVSEVADILAYAFPAGPDVDTDGEPEMVGSCARRRRDESEPLLKAAAFEFEPDDTGPVGVLPLVE